MFRILTALLLSAAVVSSAAAQSQAINGTIAGTVRDESGAVLPGVTVTITNVNTGTVRSVVTDTRGTYSAALLPLGTYRILMELSGFKSVERSGVTLSAGQIAAVNAQLLVGGVQEVIRVTANSPVTQPARDRKSVV